MYSRILSFAEFYLQFREELFQAKKKNCVHSEIKVSKFWKRCWSFGKNA